MSVFNVSDDDYMKVQQELQKTLNIIKKPEWQSLPSREQQKDIEDIQSKIRVVMVALKKWQDDEKAHPNPIGS